MKKLIAAAVIAACCTASATLAQERVGDAALGAVSGLVVLGPVGAIAGAAIGYTAGPSISGSWGLRRSARRKSVKSPKHSRVTARQAARPAEPTREAAKQEPPKEVATPSPKPANDSENAKLPINGLEM
jgi:hypothetical protein